MFALTRSIDQNFKVDLYDGMVNSQTNDQAIKIFVDEDERGVFVLIVRSLKIAFSEFYNSIDLKCETY